MSVNSCRRLARWYILCAMGTAATQTGTEATQAETDGQGAVDGAAILANARAVAPILREEAAENERGRQLTSRAVETLRSTGVFRMSMPRSWGGPEVDICTQVEIVEELSAADGSAGWCAMVGSEGGYFTAALDDAVGRRLYPDLDVVTAGMVSPFGKLHRVDGDYRFEGRWPFGSGCTHADVMYAGARVFNDGEPVMVDGRPEIRYPLLPAREFQIVDTWDTTGLAGTGSHDFTIADAFVPAEQTFQWRDLRKERREGPLYAWPGMFVARFPGVPLGIARAALEVAEELLADKVLAPEMRPAHEDARVRAEVARAYALVGSARSYVFDVLGAFWSTLETGAEPSFRQRAALSGLHVHTVQTCREAVRILADVVGSASIYRRCPLERHGRDLATMDKHTVAQPRRMELVGALWLEVEGILDEVMVTRERIV